MARANLVDIHAEAGVFADKRSRGAGVVQVDVRKENGVEIAHPDAPSLELLVQSRERGPRARVDNGAVAV